MSNDRVSAIRARLEAALEPEELEIRDESHLHVGHPGARDGRGHYHVTIVSKHFAGANSLARHRMVYEALGGLMTTDIHALSLTALVPTASTEQ